MRKPIHYCAMVAISALPMTILAIPLAACEGLPAADIEIGVEANFAPWDADSLPAFLGACKELGAGFVVFQFLPKDGTLQAGRVDKGCIDYLRMAEACKAAGVNFFVNQEVTNYSNDGMYVDRAGKGLLSNDDGTHRFDIRGRFLDELTRYREFRGVVYDEAEHGQMRREQNTNGGADSLCTWRVHPYFAATDGMSLEQAYEAVLQSARKVVEPYRARGVVPMSENVFPVMLHTFARAGFDPGVKFMKESIDPVYASIAMGAAKQYDRELCINLDLWGLSDLQPGHPDQRVPVFPGHPPAEMRASLLFAYWLGATRIFVEDAGGLLTRKERNGAVVFEPTPYGELFRWFAKDYIPSNPRPYTFRDVRPEVAILRMDDTCWGQRGSWLPDALYGSADLKSTPATIAWFGIWRLLTHGRTQPGGISFHSLGYKGLDHEFFYPLNGVVVYDHLATENDLSGLRLVFLTGSVISPGAMRAVESFVKKGGVCVTLASLVPESLGGHKGIVQDGAGRWVIGDNFESREIHDVVVPFLGRPDEIAYGFNGRRLAIRKQENGNRIRIFLHKDTPLNSDKTMTNSDRVW